VFSQVADKTITNIHGIIIYQESSRDELDSVFLGVFLGYLRRVGVLDYLSVGGQGGSLAEKYWDHIRIPSFPQSQKETIAELYHKPTCYRASKLNLAGFDSEDIKVTTELGISQLDSQMKLISATLADVLRKIVVNERVEICFDFLASS